LEHLARFRPRAINLSPAPVAPPPAPAPEAAI